MRFVFLCCSENVSLDRDWFGKFILRDSANNLDGALDFAFSFNSTGRNGSLIS